MGRRRFVGYGESATGPARRSVRRAAGRIRRWLSSRCDLFLNRAASLGLAATLLHRRTSFAIGSLCEVSRKGVGGLEKQSARELESLDTRNCFALEALSVPARHADYD